MSDLFGGRLSITLWGSAGPFHWFVLTDFVLHFDRSASGEAIADRLRDRPDLGKRPTHAFDYPWGSVVVQDPPSYGYAAYQSGGEIFFCAGRPYLLGAQSVSPGESGRLREIFSCIGPDGLASLDQRLSGMYALVRVDPGGEIELLTDQMGFRPVYEAKDSSGRILALGTQVEILADVVQRSRDFDEVSLGELVLDSRITFPYTTRSGIRELHPASAYHFRVVGEEIRVQQRVLWEPHEPGSAPSARILAEELEAAIRQSAKDGTAGCERVGVLLSGGKDSRAVLGAIPRERCTGAITFVTRANRETETAAQVAEQWGIPQFMARRGDEFYSELLPRSLRLQGAELSAVAHGFAAFDLGLHEKFDVLVGGYLSDTLLKDHFMPADKKDRLRRKSFGDVLRTIGLRAPLPVPKARDSSCALTPECLAAVEKRRRSRLEEVAMIRPSSALEWVNFWPMSRQVDMGYALANSRLFAIEELFMHRSIVDLAVRIPAEQRVGGKLANRVFPRLFGSLGKIRNANTGIAASASRSKESRALKQRRRRGQQAEFQRLEVSKSPWNDVQNSWADFELLQTLSPRWASHRERIIDHGGGEHLRGVLKKEPEDLLSEYQPSLGSSTNWILVQLGMLMSDIGNRT